MTVSQFALKNDGTINFDDLLQDGWEVEDILDDAHREARSSRDT
jgi:hypothetical protein